MLCKQKMATVFVKASDKIYLGNLLAWSSAWLFCVCKSLASFLFIPGPIARLLRTVFPFAFELVDGPCEICNGSGEDDDEDEDGTECVDIWPVNWCNNVVKNGDCGKSPPKENCKKTCEICDGSGEDTTTPSIPTSTGAECVNIWPVNWCDNVVKNGHCNVPKPKENCKKTCGVC